MFLDFVQVWEGRDGLSEGYGVTWAGDFGVGRMVGNCP